MKALLLAAGLGTRLRPITDHLPKCLVSIHGRPLLDYWLEPLLANGVQRLLVNTHYLPQAVRDFVAASPWRDRIDLVHEPELLGTGGTVLRNREFFGAAPFMVGHADNLTQFDVPLFMAAHVARPAGVEITMMTFDTDAPETCGMVEQDAQGIVVRFHEKSPTASGRRANAAVYIFEPRVIDFLVSLGKPVIDLSLEVIPHYLGRIYGFHNTGYHRDIGSPASLQRAELEFGRA